MKKFSLFFGAAILSLLIIGSLTAQGNNPANTKKDDKPSSDLVITRIKVDTSDKNNAKIIYTVENQGETAVSASAASIKVLSSAGKEIGASIKNDIPSLPPSTSYTGEINYPIRSKGKYLIKATADYNDKIAESNELNNSNTIKFSIGFGRK